MCYVFDSRARLVVPIPLFVFQLEAELEKEKKSKAAQVPTGSGTDASVIEELRGTIATLEQVGVVRRGSEYFLS